MSRLAYYPGCSLHSTAKEMDASFRTSIAALGVELTEIPGWECCGNTAAHSAGHVLATALPANELTKVRQDMGLDAVAVPCAACFSRFKATQHECEDDQVLTDVSRVIGRRASTDVGVLNLVDVYHDVVGLDTLRKRTVRPLTGLRAASYYGCLLTRPPKVTQADDPEYPMHMDEVAAALGAEPVEWGYKTDCCGASLALCEQDVVVELTRKVLANARDCGAEVVITACPLCQVNLDTRQLDIAQKLDASWQPIPVVYLSQLVGRAIGIDGSELGFRKHIVPVEAVLT
jgi:heterodisulfide reductase subunit B2